MRGSSRCGGYGRGRGESDQSHRDESLEWEVKRGNLCMEQGQTEESSRAGTIRAGVKPP